MKNRDRFEITLNALTQVPTGTHDPAPLALDQIPDAPLNLYQRAAFSEQVEALSNGRDQWEKYSDVDEVMIALEGLHDSALEYAATTTSLETPSWDRLLDFARRFAKAEANLDRLHKLEDALLSARERVANGESLRSAICVAARAVGVDPEVLAKDWLFFQRTGEESAGLTR